MEGKRKTGVLIRKLYIVLTTGRPTSRQNTDTQKAQVAQTLRYKHCHYKHSEYINTANTDSSMWVESVHTDNSEYVSNASIGAQTKSSENL